MSTTFETSNANLNKLFKAVASHIKVLNDSSTYAMGELAHEYMQTSESAIKSKYDLLQLRKNNLQFVAHAMLQDPMLDVDTRLAITNLYPEPKADEVTTPESPPKQATQPPTETEVHVLITDGSQVPAVSPG
jgi:hypothetical protein